MSTHMTIIENLGGILIMTNGKHFTYTIQYSKIKNILRKWSGNREPCFQRVEQMLSHYKQGGYLPFFLHLAVIPKEGLVCYDGNHRREVLNTLEEEEDVNCIVDLLCDASQSDVEQNFKDLNSSVQVSDIYTENTNISIRDEILSFKKQFLRQYNMYVSKSAKCMRPHFYAPDFEQQVYRVYEEFSVLHISKVIECIVRLNQCYIDGSVQIGRELSDKVITKCKKGGLWLFAAGREINIDHVREVYEKYMSKDT